MHTRDHQRDAYIFDERRKGRTFTDIGQELGITYTRVRQIYVHVCRDRRQEYFKTHPEAYKEWHENPNDKKWNEPPYVE